MRMKKFICKFMTIVMVLGMVQVPVYAEEHGITHLTELDDGSMSIESQPSDLVIGASISPSTTTFDEFIYEGSASGDESNSGSASGDELALMPLILLAATGHSNHKVCGLGEMECSGNHGCGQAAPSWNQITSESELRSAANSGGSYYLADHITLNATLNITSSNFDLCLNGKTLSLAEGKRGSVIQVAEGAKLNLCDCTATGEGESYTSGMITGATSGSGVYNNRGTFTMYGGSISGNSSKGVDNRGTFTMYGGSITGNSAMYGGGVYSTGSEGTFTMYGGSIIGNTAAIGGGVANGGTFTMHSGSITGNKAEDGGGVQNYGEFTLHSGSISGNTAERGGGVMNYDTFILHGGSITGNTLSDDTTPNNIYLDSGELITVGDLPADSEFGITAADGAGYIFTENTVTDDDLVKCFFSDDPNLKVVKNAENKLQLVYAHAHNICGGTCTHAGDAHGEEEWYAAFPNTFTGGSLTAGKYYLTKDVELDAELTIDAEVNLCLNGKVLKLADGKTGSVIQINSSGTLNLCDCSGGDGVIADNENDGNINPGVYVYGSTGIFNMYGGKISGHNSKIGGGVQNEGIFTMYGGEISGNTAEVYGGGIDNSNICTIESGNIRNNTARQGGGIENAGTLTILNVTLDGNEAQKGAGIVNLHENSLVLMEGGSIVNNTAAEGGGIYNYLGTITITGGEIMGNTATYDGGGVHTAGGTFNFNGGKITRNTAQRYFGGIAASCNFTIDGGECTDNTALLAPDVYTQKSLVAKSGILGSVFVAAGTVHLGDGVTYLNNTLDLTTQGAEFVFISPVSLQNAEVILNLRSVARTKGAVLVQGWDGSNVVPLGDVLEQFTLDQTSKDKGFYLEMTEDGALILDKDPTLTILTKLVSELSDVMLSGNVYLKSDDTEYIQMNKTDVGTYSAIVKAGTYDVLLGEDYDLLKTISIEDEDKTESLCWYSLSYDANGGTLADGASNTCYVLEGSSVKTTVVPSLDGYTFCGWSDGTTIYRTGDYITHTMDKNITLVAEWMRNTSADIEVTLNHNSLADTGFDQAETISNVTVDLQAKKQGSNDAYQTVKTLQLSANTTDHAVTHSYASEDEIRVTTYRGTAFTNLDPTMEYKLQLVKDGYVPMAGANLAEQDEQTGVWTLKDALQYNPNSFKMNVELVGQMTNGSADAIAASLKYLFFNESTQEWEVITQHLTDPVEIALDGGDGVAQYPVWQYIADTNPPSPYGNRAIITEITVGGNKLTFDTINLQTGTFASTEHGYVIDVVVQGSDRTWGGLDGVYYNGSEQVGNIQMIISDKNAKTITLDIGEDATIDAESLDVIVAQIADLAEYAPMREDGYVLEGWYLDEACTSPVTEFEYLVDGGTIYANWKAPKEIKANITVSGTYYDGVTYIPINECDRAESIEVHVEKMGPSGAWEKIPGLMQTIVITGWTEDMAVMEDVPILVPDDGNIYRIVVERANYVMSEEVYAVPQGNTISMNIGFKPTVYEQEIILDVSKIGEEFRPVSGVVLIEYKTDEGYAPIVQHNGTTKNGLVAILGEDGTASAGSEIIWTYHANGDLYEYRGALHSLVWDDGGTQELYTKETAPFEVVSTEDITVDEHCCIRVELQPKTYGITLTNMDDATNAEEFIGKGHTWSYETNLADWGTPKADGKLFVCWTLASGKDIVSKISAGTKDVTLVAVWHDLSAAPVTEVGGKTFIVVGDGKTMEDLHMVEVEATDSGLYVDAENNLYIPVDTDGDGVTDAFVQVVSDTSKNGVYTDKNGGRFIPVNRNDDGITDLYIGAKENGNGTCTGSDGKIYIPVDLDDDGNVDIFVPVVGTPDGNGVYTGEDGKKYEPVGKYPNIVFKPASPSGPSGEPDKPVSPGGSGGGSSSGGGGGGGGKPVANITVSKTENGKVTVGSTYAEKDSIVTITVTPDPGYEVESVKVTDSDGKELKVTDKGDGKYTFVKTDKKVTVSAKFVKTKVEEVKEADKTIILTIDRRDAIVFEEIVVNDVPPVIRHNRTMLPIRFIVESLGGDVKWNAADRKVSIEKDDKLIEIIIGSSVASVDGKPILLDAPAYIDNSRTYLPLRFVAENLGANVDWNATNRTVTITSM